MVISYHAEQQPRIGLHHLADTHMKQERSDVRTIFELE